MNCWLLQNDCLESPPDNTYGFVYCIINKRDGRIYVGKKAFTFRKKKVLSKKARLVANTRKRTAITAVDSKWQKYWGSSKPLLEDVKTLGEKNFERRILGFARNKSELSYLEVHWQIQMKVLHVPSYNGWISCKIYRKHLS